MHDDGIAMKAPRPAHKQDGLLCYFRENVTSRFDNSETKLSFIINKYLTKAGKMWYPVDKRNTDPFFT